MTMGKAQIQHRNLLSHHAKKKIGSVFRMFLEHISEDLHLKEKERKVMLQDKTLMKAFRTRK